MEPQAGLAHAGDCKLEYDRATGCYLDHAQMEYAANAEYGRALPQSQDAPFLSLPASSEPAYDDVFQTYGVNGDSYDSHNSFADASPSASLSASSSGGASTSKYDRMFQQSGVNGGPWSHEPVEHDHVNHRPSPDVAPQTRISTDEVEYDDTDPHPGDLVQQYVQGSPRQAVANVV